MCLVKFANELNVTIYSDNDFSMATYGWSQK